MALTAFPGRPCGIVAGPMGGGAGVIPGTGVGPPIGGAIPGPAGESGEAIHLHIQENAKVARSLEERAALGGTTSACACACDRENGYSLARLLAPTMHLAAAPRTLIDHVYSPVFHIAANPRVFRQGTIDYLE